MFASRIPAAHVARIIEMARHRLGRLQQRLVPPPIAVMEMVMNAWAAQAITATADLGIADALAKGPLPVDELASAVNADADAVSRLLRGLTGRGLFRLRRDGRYELTPLGDCLRSDAEVSLRGLARFVGAPQHREHWSHLTDAIRTGRPAVPELRGKPMFEYLADEPEFAEVFNAAMTSVSELAIAPVVAGYDFSRYDTIVDVGGGHGRLLAAILEAAPRARGVLCDLPHVVAGAPAVMAERGVQDRVTVVPGSFFDAIPEGGDAYVLKHIIHDWPDDDAVQILSNVRKVADVGKHVLLVEFVIPGHDREFLGNWGDLEMLLVVGARERAGAQYGRLLDRAGFRMKRVVNTTSPFSVVEAVAV
ncbi:methyltransferase [Mycobacterium sp. Dal123C01]|uniref:methyltransferase n=1 Tax=Mycobacterium sp. Dal123C01 TaxID=3457577 RepID=UPI00403EB1E9